MLVDRYPREDVFARVPELAAQTAPVLRQLDRLLDDDALYARVRADLGRRCPKTLCRGRPSAPVEALLRLLLVKHLYDWSYRETERRVADGPVLRRSCRVSCRRGGRGSPAGGSCASTGRSWRRRSTTRPTAACSPTACASSAA
jgi:transposase, IS5 family